MNFKETHSDLTDLEQIIAELSQPAAANEPEAKWPTADEIKARYRLSAQRFKALAEHAISQDRLKVGYRMGVSIVGYSKRVPTYLFTGGAECKPKQKPKPKRRSSSTHSSRTSTSTRSR